MGSTTLHHVHSPEINGVIDELAYCSMLKEAPEITVMVRVQNYPSVGSERAQAAIFSWIVDV